MNHRTLRRRPRQLRARAGRAGCKPHRRQHAVVTQAQRHRIRQCRPRFHRKCVQVIVLQVQCCGGAQVHALNVLPRHCPNQTVVIQIQALHTSQERRQLSRERVMAQVHDRPLAVRWLRLRDHRGDPPREIVPLQQQRWERSSEERRREGPTETVHAEIEVH